jgi:hypothetical protein
MNSFNLNEYERLADSFLGNDLKLQFRKDRNEEAVTHSIDLNIRGIDDNLLLELSAFNNGNVWLRLALDFVDDPSMVYPLINLLNKNCPWLKAFVDSNQQGNNFVVITSWNYQSTNASEGVGYVEFVLHQLVSEDVLQYLRPIAAITHP